MHSASLVTTGLGPSRSSPGRLVGKWQAGASDRRWPSELQPSSPGIRSGRTSRPWSSPWTAASPRGPVSATTCPRRRHHHLGVRARRGI